MVLVIVWFKSFAWAPLITFPVTVFAPSGTGLLWSTLVIPCLILIIVVPLLMVISVGTSLGSFATQPIGISEANESLVPLRCPLILVELIILLSAST